MADDVGGALTGLSQWLGLTRPPEQFSRDDEAFRNKLLELALPEQRASIDATQRQLWKNDFDRQVVPGFNTGMRHENWREDYSKMPDTAPFITEGLDRPESMPVGTLKTIPIQGRKPDGNVRGAGAFGSAKYPNKEWDAQPDEIKKLLEQFDNSK